MHLIELEHLSAASNDHLGLRHRKRWIFFFLSFARTFLTNIFFVFRLEMVVKVGDSGNRDGFGDLDRTIDYTSFIRHIENVRDLKMKEGRVREWKKEGGELEKEGKV